MNTKTMSKKKPKRSGASRSAYVPAVDRPVYTSTEPVSAARLRAAAVKARTLAARLDDCAKGAATFDTALVKAERLAAATDELRAALLACNASNLLPPGADN